jgi:retron-type reverse transcriptase
VNIILNGKGLKAFSLKWGTRQGCPLSPLLISMLLEVLFRPIKKLKEIEDIQTGKAVKWFFFTDDLILHVKSPKDGTKTYQWAGKLNVAKI